MTARPLISLVSPCFNEEGNIAELYRRAVDVMAKLPQYDFEYVFIDNASTDGTVDVLRALAAADTRVKVIINNRNFGPLRSPYYALLQTSGEATISLAADLQCPPEMIPEFLSAWESGYQVVLAVKPRSETNPLVHGLRKLYYRGVNAISDVPIVLDATGFGLFDKVVVDKVREMQDPYPFMRGLVAELGYSIKTIPFVQPKRHWGRSKLNLYALYDIAMLGIVSHSVVPIRLAAFFGFVIGVLSILVAFAYLALKLTFWQQYPVGVAPLMIGLFFMFGVVLVFIGILGEYIASIHTYVRRRPIVVERERINF